MTAGILRRVLPFPEGHVRGLFQDPRAALAGALEMRLDVLDVHEDTESWLALLDREILAKHPDLRAEVRQWVYEPGLPATAPQPKSDAFAKVEAQAQAFAAGTAAASLATQGWSTHEWLHFLRTLPEPLPAERMADLDQTFKLSDSGNSEVLAAWLEKVIASSYAPAYPGLALPDRHGPAEVPPAALHSVGEDPRRRRAGAADLREGSARVPHGVAAND